MNPLRLIAQLVSWIALAAVIVPSLLYLAGSIDLPTTKWIMLIATVAWFIATPSWMGVKRADNT